MCENVCVVKKYVKKHEKIIKYDINERKIGFMTCSAFHILCVNVGVLFLVVESKLPF
jgi:hypothetical protein